MEKFYSQVNFLDKSKGERFNAVVGFKDETGTVLASIKKQFRNEADATAFVSKKYELKTDSEANEATGETQTVFTVVESK